MGWFNKSTNLPTAVVPAVSDSMKHIYQAVLNHVEMKTNGALLVTGNWGSGKTYYFKKVIFPNLEAENGTESIIVSLYGATDKNSIANKVLFAYLDKKGNGSRLSTASIAQGTQNLIDAIPALKKHIDITKLFKASGEDLFRFLPKDKFLICFDDLERMSEKINPDDFMGLVNELVENKGYTVVIIAHEKEIKGGIKYKEKTIEKTIHFKNDLSSIYDSIVEGNTDDDFKKYLIQNKPFFLNSFDPRHKVKEKQDKLTQSFENIRSLKFAIEHFRRVFEIIHKNNIVGDALKERQLREVWIFILAVSIEFKNFYKLSYLERRHLDDPSSSLSTEDLGTLLWSYHAVQEAKAEDEWTFRNEFIEDYFSRVDVPYLYFHQVYDFITAGTTIDEASFLVELTDSYNVENGAVKPQYEHLAKFMQHGLWNFADDEFVPALQQLLNYAETGQFSDLLSYNNSGFYLLPFNEQLGLTKEEILQRLKDGADIAIPQMQQNFLTASHFEIANSGVQDGHLKQLKDHIKAQLKAKIEADALQENQRLEAMFINDLPSFVKELLPKDSHVRSPEPLLFNHFNVENIVEAVANWTPAGIMALSSLLVERYSTFSYPDRLTDEIPFLSSLKEHLQENPNVQKVLSNHLITAQLIPELEDAINKLNSLLPVQPAEIDQPVIQEDGL